MGPADVLPRRINSFVIQKKSLSPHASLVFRLLECKGDTSTDQVSAVQSGRFFLSVIVKASGVSSVLWTLMGRVSVFPGPFQNPFSRLLSDESDEGALFAAQKLFSTILKLGSTANPKLSACGGSNSWICGRYASLRIVSEKILTRAQSFLSHFLVKYSGNSTKAKVDA